MALNPQSLAYQTGRERAEAKEVSMGLGLGLGVLGPGLGLAVLGLRFASKRALLLELVRWTVCRTPALIPSYPGYNTPRTPAIIPLVPRV